ncbi:MAG: hypothetical protein ACAH07_07485 [Methylophilaceae bacterium]|nr:hypothetical protein [Methyloradius sp.]
MSMPDYKMMSRQLSMKLPSSMRGQSMVEYFVVTSFTVIILITGADSSVIQQLIVAIKDAYAGFTYAMSFSTNLNVL